MGLGRGPGAGEEAGDAEEGGEDAGAHALLEGHVVGPGGHDPPLLLPINHFPASPSSSCSRRQGYEGREPERLLREALAYAAGLPDKARVREGMWGEEEEGVPGAAAAAVHGQGLSGEASPGGTDAEDVASQFPQPLAYTLLTPLRPEPSLSSLLLQCTKPSSYVLDRHT